MKKNLLTIGGILMSMTALAQNSAEPVIVEDLYIYGISPNGAYLCNRSGNAAIYTIATGETDFYIEGSFGMGNTIANNGMGVGDVNGTPAVFYKGEVITQENYNDYFLCNINAITYDASKVVGFMNNTGGGMSYIPFVAELDEQGKVGAPTILPTPEKDLFGSIPQYVTAVWISDDGNTIIGQVTDNMGYYTYPIIFTIDDSGEWSYSLPTESLFNPTGIEIPVNPWENEPAWPDPLEFMSGALKQAYEEALNAANNGGGTTPIPEQYMTDEEYDAYAEAVEKYNDWFYGEQTAIKDYIEIYNEILSTSPTFQSNAMTLQPTGEMMCVSGGTVDNLGTIHLKLYVFNLWENTINVMDPPADVVVPYQILSDGTMVVAQPLKEGLGPNTWFLLPDSEEFITVQDYLTPEHPEYAEYIDEHYPGGNGLVSVSDDMNTMAGCVFVTELAEYDPEADLPLFVAYILTDLDTAGVESIVKEPENGVYRVYNLNGLKVLETKDAGQVNSLPKGFYIINGKKVILR